MDELFSLRFNAVIALTKRKGILKMKIYLIIACLMASISLGYAADKKTNVLVLDTSDEMRSEIDGQRKVDLLKIALSDVIQFWPKGEQLAVLSYRGHNKNHCNRDPLPSASKKPLTKVQFEQLTESKASGDFPMLFALYQAKNQLSNQQGNIVLISAGSDPCQKILICDIVKQMKKDYPKIFIHTLDMQGDNATLQCISTATKGEYYSIYDILKRSTVTML